MITQFITKNKDTLSVLAVTTTILLIPFIAMQYTTEVNWTLSDFVFAGVMLSGTGILFVSVYRYVSNSMYRLAAGITLFASLLLIWINGAVGIIGDGPINLLYLTVLGIEFLGACLVGFKARGMAKVSYIAAIMIFVIPIIALLINEPDFSPGVLQVFSINAFFVMLFVGSGALFQHAVIKNTDN